MTGRIEQFREYRQKMNERMFELFKVGLIVGGSIVIPRLRRGVELLDEIDPSAN